MLQIHVIVVPYKACKFKPITAKTPNAFRDGKGLRVVGRTLEISASLFLFMKTKSFRELRQSFIQYRIFLCNKGSPKDNKGRYTSKPKPAPVTTRWKLVTEQKSRTNETKVYLPKSLDAFLSVTDERSRMINDRNPVDRCLKWYTHHWLHQSNAICTRRAGTYSSFIRLPVYMDGGVYEEGIYAVNPEHFNPGICILRVLFDMPLINLPSWA